MTIPLVIILIVWLIFSIAIFQFLVSGILVILEGIARYAQRLANRKKKEVC